MAGIQHRPEGAIALLSIHPHYVELIRKGAKCVEFRRRPFARAISHIVIYSTAPVQRLVGFCEVDQVVTGPPATLWSRYKRNGGITREALLKYLEGLNTAVAIVIKRFIPLERLAALPEIGIKHPPQSFQYLDDRAFHSLTSKHGQLGITSANRPS